VSCSAISPADWNLRPGSLQQPRVGRVLDEQPLGLGQGEPVLTLEVRELEGEHGQAPADRVEVGARRRAVGLDLRRLVPDRSVDRAVAVDGPDAAHVDELDLLLELYDVVRLEVAVDEPAVVQVAERGQDLERVGERDLERHRAAGLLLAGLEPDLLQRLAADVLHHDVAGRLAVTPACVLHEVVDADDVRVLDLGEELPLGEGGGHRVRVPGVEQALEHHPAVADVAVLRQVNPAESAVGEAAEHQVLPGHQLTGDQLGTEGVGVAAVRAEPVRRAGPAVARLADGIAAVAAEPAALRDPRVGEHGRRRVDPGNRRHVDEAGAEPAAGGVAA
jgi:hypothetical protein